MIQGVVGVLWKLRRREDIWARGNHAVRSCVITGFSTCLLYTQTPSLKTRHYLVLEPACNDVPFAHSTMSHYKPHIIKNTKQQINAAAFELEFIALVPDAASGASVDVDEVSPDASDEDEVPVEELEESVDDDEEINEASSDASDEVPADELDESVGDDFVGSSVNIVSTTSSPSLAVEVTTTSLLDSIELAPATSSAPAIPAHT
jgi:hypothetical protein